MSTLTPHSRFHCSLCPLEELPLHLLLVHLVITTTRQLKVKEQGPHQAKDQLLVSVDDVVTGDTHQVHMVSLQSPQSSLHILMLANVHLHIPSQLRGRVEDRQANSIHCMASTHELAQRHTQAHICTHITSQTLEKDYNVHTDRDTVCTQHMHMRRQAYTWKGGSSLNYPRLVYACCC